MSAASQSNNLPPTNHHYVSRCLIKNFFDHNNKIYTYDKNKNIYDRRTSSKRMFSEKTLNSKIDKNGNIDHKSIEVTLNKYFEMNFPIHYNRINDLVTNLENNTIKEPSNSDELTESINYILRMAIIGDMRTPEHKMNTESIILGTYESILKNATEEIQAAFQDFFYRHRNVKHLNLIDFKKISDSIIKNMGEYFFTILVAPKGYYFLLPDCSSVTWRTQLVDDSVVDGVTYYNPSRPIAVVGMPINSHIFILIEAQKISTHKSDSIRFISEDYATTLNKWLYKSANKLIACQNDSFLKEFIEKIKLFT